MAKKYRNQTDASRRSFLVDAALMSAGITSANVAGSIKGQAEGERSAACSEGLPPPSQPLTDPLNTPAFITQETIGRPVEVSAADLLTALGVSTAYIPGLSRRSFLMALGGAGTAMVTEMNTRNVNFANAQEEQKAEYFNRAISPDVARTDEACHPPTLTSSWIKKTETSLSSNLPPNKVPAK